MIEYLVFEVREEKFEGKPLNFVDVVEASNPEEAIEKSQEGEYHFDVERFFAIPETYIHQFKLNSKGELFEEDDIDLDLFKDSFE